MNKKPSQGPGGAAANEASIESLRAAISRIEIPEDQYALYRALDELEALRERDAEEWLNATLSARIRREAAQDNEPKGGE